MSTPRQSAIINFVQQFVPDVPSLEKIDGLEALVPAAALIQYLSGNPVNVDTLQAAVSAGEWFPIFKEIRSIYGVISSALKDTPGYSAADISAIARRKDISQIELLFTHIIQYSTKSPKKSEAIAKIKTFTGANRKEIALIIKGGTATPSKSSDSPSDPSNPPSPTQSPPSVPSQTQSHVQSLAQTAAKTQESDSELEELKKKAALLKGQIQHIKQEIEKSKEDIKVQKQTEESESSRMDQIATLNADCFSTQIANDTKKQRIQMFKSVEASIKSILEAREQKLKEIESISSKVDAVSLLRNRLQDLRLHPNQQKMEELKDQRKKCAQVLKKLKQQREILKSKVDGQQSVAVLEEKLQFMKKLEEESVHRQQRLGLSLALQKRKIRIDMFQREMRAFV